MAKITTKNELIKELRGAVGGLVFRPMPDGSIWVSTAPHYGRRKFSKGQKDHQQRFREAASYARWAARVLPIYAQLAEGTMKTAYNIALSDWFDPPVVHCIERRDGRILIEASDKVMVTKVKVTILSEEGQIFEKGQAIKGEGDWWEFASHAEGKRIMVEAWDLPGHVSKLVM